MKNLLSTSEKYRLVFPDGFIEGLLRPVIPVYGVFGVLKQVRAALVFQVVAHGWTPFHIHYNIHYISFCQKVVCTINFNVCGGDGEKYMKVKQHIRKVILL